MSPRVFCRVLLGFLVLGGLAAPLLWGEPPAKRYAVIVGVKDYDHAKLQTLEYAVNDAAELAKLLKDHDYDVTVLKTGADDAKLVPTRENIEARLEEVLEKCTKRDTVLVALSGHGLQFEKHNPTDPEDAYFCPQDAKPLPERRETLVSLARVYRRLDDSGAGVKLLLVDACRDDPTAPKGVRRGVDGTNSPRPPKGVAALFSCSAGESAFEHPKLKHGVFFHYVLEGQRGKAASEGEVTWDDLTKYVRRRVARDVGELVGGGARQSPSLNSGELSGEPPVLLILTTAAVAQPAPAKAPFGEGAAKQFQRSWAESLGCKVEESVDLGGGEKMEFVLIPPGTFTMGTPDSEAGHDKDEGPQHEVTISKPFFLGKSAVTRGQFKRFVDEASYQTDVEKDGKGGGGYDPDKKDHIVNKKYTWRNTGFAQSDDHPVVNLTWNDAQAYCNWLTKKERSEFRLPTEAEWEYAGRAGTRTRFHFGDDEADLRHYANIADQSLLHKGDKFRWTMGLNMINFPNNGIVRMEFVSWDDGYPFTSPVGKFRPNPFGLYDMHGNIRVWCQDSSRHYSAASQMDPTGLENALDRTTRGGSWYLRDGHYRVGYRDKNVPSYRDYDLGFRLARVPPGGH